MASKIKIGIFIYFIDDGLMGCAYKFIETCPHKPMTEHLEEFIHELISQHENITITNIQTFKN